MGEVEGPHLVKIALTESPPKSPRKIRRQSSYQDRPILGLFFATLLALHDAPADLILPFADERQLVLVQPLREQHGVRGGVDVGLRERVEADARLEGLEDRRGPAAFAAIAPPTVARSGRGMSIGSRCRWAAKHLPSSAMVMPASTVMVRSAAG